MAFTSVFLDTCAHAVLCKSTTICSAINKDRCLTGKGGGDLFPKDKTSRWTITQTGTTKTGSKLYSIKVEGTEDQFFGIDPHGGQVSDCRANLFTGDRNQVNPYTQNWMIESGQIIHDIQGSKVYITSKKCSNPSSNDYLVHAHSVTIRHKI